VAHQIWSVPKDMIGAPSSYRRVLSLIQQRYRDRHLFLSTSAYLALCTRVGLAKLSEHIERKANKQISFNVISNWSPLSSLRI